MKAIILHGLYMHGLVMMPMAQKLRELGYQTRIISYNSLAINERRLFNQIDRALSVDQTNILIGHSLGGLVIRQYLESRQPDTRRISHVVTLGSPLQGASIVDRIHQLGLKKLLGNAPEFGLDRHQASWPFPQKLGSIAGTLPLGARSLLLWQDPSLSDGTVTVEETKIDGMTDHLLVKTSHTSMLYSSRVLQQIDHFVHHDQFIKHPAKVTSD